VVNGYYVATFTTKSPNGRKDARSVALRRHRGRFIRLRPFQRKDPCAFVRNARLRSPVFGGLSNSRAVLSFRVAERANVRIVVRRGRRVVRRYKTRSFRAGRTHRKRLGIPARARRGAYRVELIARKPGHGSRVTVTGRKL
jgi:hypothetical protein